MNLEALLLARYPSPEWAVFFEVSDSTGWGTSRRADAVALGIWPSRGLSLIGFEFKRDRRDWLRERQNPAKAERIAAHVDSWWLVVSDAAIVRDDELPEGWGLLAPTADGKALKALRAATSFPGRDLTTIKRSFAAAMLRKVTETTVPKAVLSERVEEAVKLARERDPLARQLQRSNDERDRLQERVDAFERASGIKIDGWDSAEKIGEAVKAVLHFGDWRRQARDAQRALVAATRYVDEAVAVAEAQGAASRPNGA